MSASPNNPAPGSTNLNPRAATGNSAVPPGFHHSDHRALETLLALSSLHEQIRRRRAQELDKGARLGPGDAWELKQLVHDEVLQLVAERALIVTGADGVAVALVDGSGIVCRAASGKIAPEKGARLDPYSGFSGACLRTGEVVRCDDSERDSRVSAEACQRLGTRSMVAVPLATPSAIVGVVEVFSTEPFGFNDSDVRSLTILSELILDAMKPEEENHLAEISQRVVGAANVPGAPARESSVTAASPGDNNPEVPKVAASKIRTEQGPKNPTNEEHPSRHDAKLVLFPAEYADDSRPGLKLVVILILLAAALGAGLWWQMRHDSKPNPAERKVVSENPIAKVASQDKPAADSSSVASATSAAAGTDSTTQNQTDQAAASASSSAEKLPQIIGIRHWSSDNSSTVVIDLEDQVQYEAHRLNNPERIYVDLLDTALARPLLGKVIEVDDPVLQRIRIAQPKPGVTRVVMDTKGASNYSVSMEQNPFRLVVAVGKLGSKVGNESKLNLFGPAHPSETTSNAALFPATQSENSKSTTTNSSPLMPSPSKSGDLFGHATGFNVTLDAGHGGWDFGTVGRKGLLEKDLVMDIVQRLGTLLEQRLNAKVTYTRLDDSYVALEKRAEIANLSQSNLFISIHANYSDLATARGVETYYTNTYSSLKARPADDDANPSLQNVNWNKVDIREKVQESHHLAECVQHALYDTVATKNPGIRNRGVKQAEYAVLTGTSMPAILAEVSFVSSPADENELQNEAYRQRIAEAIYKGIARYRETGGPAAMASLLGKSDAR